MGEPGLVGPDSSEQPQDRDSATQAPPTRRKQRTSYRTSTRRTVRHRLHALYFSLAALWGFLAGTGAVLVGLTATGRSAGISSRCSIFLACAAIVALVGGLVVAAAYRSASRRYR